MQRTRTQHTWLAAHCSAYNSSSRRVRGACDALFWPLHACGTHRDSQAGTHTHTHSRWAGCRFPVISALRRPSQGFESSVPGQNMHQDSISKDHKKNGFRDQEDVSDSKTLATEAERVWGSKETQAEPEKCMSFRTRAHLHACEPTHL